MIQASLRNRNSASDSESSVVRRPREFYNAVIQSGAVYTGASLSLVVTFSMDPNVLFYPAMCIISPLMVRPACASQTFKLYDGQLTGADSTPHSRASRFLLLLSTRTEVVVHPTRLVGTSNLLLRMT